MSIRVTQIGVGGFDENFSYIIHDLATKEGFVVDPSGTFQRVIHAVQTLNIQIHSILLTHSHGDHYDALGEAVQTFPDAVVRIHEHGASRIPGVVQSCVDGEQLSLGAGSIEVLHTPGHTDDSICLFVPATTECPPQLVSGDTVFIDGCGRISADATETMFASLQRVKQLPSETIIYPGHDYGPTPTDTLVRQRETNRFLNTDDMAEFSHRRFGSAPLQ